MDIRTYQLEARKTAVYPGIGTNIYYPTLGLCGESGEVAEKIKKVMRDKDGRVDEATSTELKKEIGDVLWYLANLSFELNLNLEDIALANLDKLRSRQDRNQLHGSGDNR